MIHQLLQDLELVDDLCKRDTQAGEFGSDLQELRVVDDDDLRADYLRRGLTVVNDGTQVKVVSWYDNEWGYSSRLVDLAARVLERVPVAV